MSHFDICTMLKQVNLPYNANDWDNMNVNVKNKIYAELIKKQVNDMQGIRFAVVCMGRVSLYDTLAEAMVEMNNLNKMFHAQLYYPIGTDILGNKLSCRKN